MLEQAMRKGNPIDVRLSAEIIVNENKCTSYEYSTMCYTKPYEPLPEA